MSRLICENCSFGYNPKLSNCSWCDAPSYLAHVSNQVSYLDTECYPNYFLVRFSTGELFELFSDTELDCQALIKALSNYTIYTFNGIGYDIPMLAGALSGKNCEQLKLLSDSIIIQGVKYWELPGLDWIDHVDIMQIAPGKGSQKIYGAKLHTKHLQDLPYDPAHKLGWYEVLRVREYCGIDLVVLQELCEALKPALEFREAISKAEGLDVRSKSGPQIVETVCKKMLGRKIKIPAYQPGSQFYFRPSAWLKFLDLDVLDLLSRCPFTITESGHAALAAELASTVIKIGGTEYQLGAGGLHSKEKSVAHVASDAELLTDFDISSMYPATIINLGIYPPQLGEQFKIMYKSWRDDRIKDKHEGRLLEADAKKLKLNACFGKLLDRHSIFYAPAEGMQVTITGQLAMLMLIERLEFCGVQVVSANTDGILIKCKRILEPLRDIVIKQWEALTNYSMESTEYAAIFERDVNNYIAIKNNGDVKLKGVFAEPVPTASNWPAPSGQICVTAIVQYLINNTPIADTIHACTDIRQFIYVRTVKGGGVFSRKPHFTKRPSKRYEAAMLSQYNFASYEDLLNWSQSDSEYLGKSVRWYYSQNSTGSIRYAESGNLVARTEGCSPCMVLPDALPDDLDFDWYVREATDLLIDIGKNT